MNVLGLLRSRFRDALTEVAIGAGLDSDVHALADLVLPSQDPKFGDYQANAAMPLAKTLKQPPREVAETICRRLDLGSLAARPEVAGPGFINVRLDDRWIEDQLEHAFSDENRLGVATVQDRRVIVIDYSSPNVAKPMHVGHIRSTVIGDSLYRVLRFLGHRTISDNHIGDWGTQFGMILYGYKHFRDVEAYRERPVEELGRLYRFVNQLVEYHDVRDTQLAELEQRRQAILAELDNLQAATVPDDKKAARKHQKMTRQVEDRLGKVDLQLEHSRRKLAAVEDDPVLAKAAREHSRIAAAVLQETALLHVGDPTNHSLWEEFLYPCCTEIEATYQRLGTNFNHTLGESFYHNRLAAVVRDLKETNIATESDGAVCVFLESFDTPMIVQKQDGAFLYATTDLATIQYRMEEFRPDAILYVVDHRQSLHFEQLFATARKWGYTDVELTHVSFGTVLGEDKRPYKTRSGTAIGLTSLLDEAVRHALAVVSQNDDERPTPLLPPETRQQVAETVGIGAIKYADLSHNRTSDYVFSYDKMVATSGNTATYMQYSYARVQSILAKGGTSPEEVRRRGGKFVLQHPAERALALEILRLEEALLRVASDYRPNHLTNYLFELASRFSTFFDACHVNNEPDETIRTSRQMLCDLTARTIALGLGCLGIEVAERI